jgi:hypothetical protein
MKSNIIEDFNLPKYVKGKSFAEASKAINKKFEGREGTEVERTKQELLKRLSEAQEYVKMQESLKANSQEVPDMMNGAVPEGFEQNQMSDGGEIATDTLDEAQSQIGLSGIMGMTGTALNLGMNAFGPTGVDTSGQTRPEKESMGLGIAEGAVQGASAGAALGPIGAIGGAVIGGGLNALGVSAANKDREEGLRNNDLVNSTKTRNDFSGGGWVLNNALESTMAQKNKGKVGDANFDPAEYSTNFTPKTNVGLVTTKSPLMNDYKFGENAFKRDTPQFKDNVEGLDSTVNHLNSSGKTQAGMAISKASQWLGDNYGNILRTAPAISNAMQLKNLEKPNKVTLDRLDSKYKTDYVDERALENRVQNEYSNSVNNLTNAANGSAGALRSNILSAGIGKAKATSEAFIKAEDINRQEDRAAQQFNNRNDMMNLRQGTMEQQMNDQNEGAYNSAKSALQSQLATDIGNFGKERVNMKQVAEMFGYGWDGEYFIDKKGNKIDPKTIGNKDESK